MPPTPTNESLIAQIQAGDGEALWILHDRLSDLLREVVERYLPEQQGSEDILREMFESIRDRAVFYRPEFGSALGWMMTTARRLAQQRARELAASVAQTAEAPEEASRAAAENSRPTEEEMTIGPGAAWAWLKSFFRIEPFRPFAKPVRS